jgi:hypothetical protein
MPARPPFPVDPTTGLPVPDVSSWLPDTSTLELGGAGIGLALLALGAILWMRR